MAIAKQPKWRKHRYSSIRMLTTHNIHIHICGKNAFMMLVNNSFIPLPPLFDVKQKCLHGKICSVVDYPYKVLAAKWILTLIPENWTWYHDIEYLFHVYNWNPFHDANKIPFHISIDYLFLLSVFFSILIPFNFLKFTRSFIKHIFIWHKNRSSIQESALF